MDNSTTMRLFDVATGKERVVPGHRNPPAPRFSAEGKTLLTSCAETHYTWDLTPVLARRPGAGFPAPTSQRTKNAWESLADEYSHDGRLVLRCDRSEKGGKVEVLDTATGKPVSTLEGAK